MSIKAIFAASALVASSLVNAAVLPVRQAANAGPTCADKAAGAIFSTKSAAKNQYDVICGRDYNGGDLRLEWVADFGSCLAACDAEKQCASVAYANYACYLKSVVPGLSENAGVWSAKKTPAPTCEGNASEGATYATSAGSFQIMCGKDYGGNDLGGFRTDTFADCIDACAANEECVDVSFQYGACYPKRALGTISEVGSVWTAKFLGTRASASSSAVLSSTSTPSATDSASSTVSATSTASSTVSATSTATPEIAKALTCQGTPNDNGALFKSTSGELYTVECGVDHWGGDIGSVAGTTTFEECMNHCEANKECINVSWVWGTCYMKNAVNEGQTVGHVWTGRRNVATRVAVVSSSSIEVSSTVSATPSISVGSSSVEVTATSSAAVEASSTAEASITPSVIAASSSADNAAVTSSAVVDASSSVASTPTETPSVTPSATDASAIVTVTPTVTPTPSVSATSTITDEPVATSTV